jgi:NTP pyrophosphatase (non-canonical NTP hydrolase)
MWNDIDRLHAHHGPIVLGNQLLKLTEEVGETAEAYIGMEGLNARKGVSHTREDLLSELGDVIVTAAIAMVAASEGDPAKAREHFDRRMGELTARAGLG